MSRFLTCVLRICRRLTPVLAGAAFLMAASSALAQAPPGGDAPAPAGQSYILSYLVTVVMIGLGMGLVVKPAERLKEVKFRID